MKQLLRDYGLRLTLVLLSVELLACAGSLTTRQTGRVLKPGHVQASANASVYVSSTFIKETVEGADVLVDRLSDAERRGEPITEEEQAQAIETGLAIVLFSPAVVPEFTLRVGLVDRFDLGLDYAGERLGFDGKFQLLRQDIEGVDLAVHSGYGYHFGVGAGLLSSLHPLLSYVGLGGYSRHDLHAGTILSGEWEDVFSCYLALRYQASFIKLDADLSRVQTVSGLGKTQLSNTMHHVIGSAGFLVGYKHVFFNAELTTAGAFFKPKVLGSQRNFNGAIVVPSVGIVVRI